MGGFGFRSRKDFLAGINILSASILPSHALKTQFKEKDPISTKYEYIHQCE
jgi:hypothetical protein